MPSRTKPAAAAALVAVSMIGIAPTAVAAPVAAVIDDIEYRADDSDPSAGAVVADYVGDSGRAVDIPEVVELDGTPYRVTAIGNRAFISAGLTSVTIPDSVTTIGFAAFASNALTTVTIPAGVSTIDEAAFYNNALTTVTIPDSVTTIALNAFALNDLDSVTFRGAPPSVGSSAFGGDPVLRFLWRYGEPQHSGGFTTPDWLGYDTEAVAVVAFDATGSGPAHALSKVVVGAPIPEPEEPTRDGYAFAGWHTAAAGGTPWDFAESLAPSDLSTESPTADLILYAHWVPVLPATGTHPMAPLGTAALLLVVGSVILAAANRVGRMHATEVD